jgi:RimJ/RimL family protein N-acetyltransferase
VSVVLRPISPAACAALAAGRPPPDAHVAFDYPTEFSAGVGASAGAGRELGPFFMHRADDGVVVGEIGGAFTGPGQVEIGYAVVASCWGRGYATAAVRAFLEVARAVPAIERVVAHTPLDRPESGRVLEKAGFSKLGETNDEHEGVPLRVLEWEWRWRPS